jgi:D-alanyl-D-alanine endopeptidase (penicillin-binding protein 7)
MNKPTAFFPTLLLSLAISLSFAGFAEAKEPSADAKHSVSHSSKNTAKKDVAVNKSKKEKVAASKKSAKSEKVALKDAKKVKISAKNKANKVEKVAKKTSKTEKIAKKSLKTGKTVAQKFTPSTKVERDAQRKDRNREKLAKISRTGKISQAAKYAAKPVIIASTPAAAVASIRNSIQQSSNTPLTLNVESRAALVMNAVTGEVLYSKNTEQALPIASITKLMTVMVVLDAAQPLDEPITITDDDVDRMRNTTSRLKVGAVLSRAELMLLALMSSENRAAHALARNYVGGTPAALAAMNRKAHAIGMSNSRFFDGTGLSSGNVATPKDLALMVKASTTYPLIRRFSTTSEHAVAINNNVQQFRNTNYLVKSPDWEIGVSKTGFINEAGKCLVMQAKIKQTPVVMVLMDSMGKYTRIGDAQRVKKWLEAVPAN